MSRGGGLPRIPKTTSSIVLVCIYIACTRLTVADIQVATVANKTPVRKFISLTIEHWISTDTHTHTLQVELLLELQGDSPRHRIGLTWHWILQAGFEKTYLTD